MAKTVKGMQIFNNTYYYVRTYVSFDDTAVPYEAIHSYQISYFLFF